MILVDANVFMYAAGKPHPHKAPSVAFLERVARRQIDAATDAEVLQEILHRYRALRRWSEGRSVYDLARTIVPAVLPITGEVVDEARRLLDQNQSVSARDALHAAVFRESRARAFCSFDSDFDRIPGMRRIEPQAV